MTEKTITLSQALDYLDNLEVNSDSEEESLSKVQQKYISSLHSILVHQAVMLILMMKTQQQQIQVILAVINSVIKSSNQFTTCEQMDSFRHFTSNWL